MYRSVHVHSCLLYAADSEHIKNNFLVQFKRNPFDCVRVDDLEFNKFNLGLERLAWSRRQILFFSPAFLKFLIWNFYKAQVFVKKLNPLVTIVLFCRELQESGVKDNPAAFLPFYSHWPKFHVLEMGQKCVFPPFLMQYIRVESVELSRLTYFSTNMCRVPELIQDFEGITGGLLLLYTTDAESIKNDFLHELRGVPFDCICIDDPKSKRHPALKRFTCARQQIIFLSPRFLESLERNFLKAYVSVGYLNPLITIALLCCGLSEDDKLLMMLACRLEPFYYLWPKFQVLHEDGRSIFPVSLIQYILAEFPAKNVTTRNIVVVPELLKEYSTAYAIFPYTIPNLEDISVHIEDNSNVKISPERINPYVIQFQIPAMILENYRTFSVQIQQSNCVIAEEMLKVADEHIYQEIGQRKDSILTTNANYVALKEEIQVSSDDDDISVNRLSCTPSELQNIRGWDIIRTESLMSVCEKYGLELGQLFANEFCHRIDANNKELLSGNSAVLKRTYGSSPAGFVLPTSHSILSLASNLRYCDLIDEHLYQSGSGTQSSPYSLELRRVALSTKVEADNQPNLLKRVSNHIEVGEKENNDQGECPNSPIYIIPDELRHFCPVEKSGLQAERNRRKPASPTFTCPVTVAHVCAKQKNSYVASYVTSKIKAERSTKKDPTMTLNRHGKQVEIPSSNRHLMPNPFLKPKVNAASMFYINRRWNSSVDLKQESELQMEHVYLKILDNNEYKSIKDRSVSKD